MSGWDRAVDALDAGLELAAAPAYGEVPTEGLEWCWRCTAVVASSDVGLCDACLAALSDESTTVPAPVDDLLLTVAERILERTEAARRAAAAVGLEWEPAETVVVVAPGMHLVTVRFESGTVVACEVYDA